MALRHRPLKLPSADGVEAPLPGHALQLVRATVLELDARARDEVLDRLRDEHLSARREAGHAGADVHRQPGELLPHALALARVDPRADLEPQVWNALDDLAGARDRACRPVEAREEPVAGGVDLD